MRTPISYYGGKQSIIGHILPLVPVHEVYTEVFFGGGTVFFAKDPVKNETVNDKLNVVVNFYEVLKLKFRKLKPLINASIMSRIQHRKALDMIQKKRVCSDVELAWAFWYCCNFSYFNKIGAGPKFSNDQSVVVPRVMHNKKSEFTDALVARLENTMIEHTDACKLLRSRNVAKAFHYIDPPYVGSDQGHYRGYNEADFMELLCTLAYCKGKFLLSHYPHALLDAEIKANGWHRKDIHIRLKAPRKSNPVKHEVLVWNYDATPASVKLDLFSNTNTPTNGKQNTNTQASEVDAEMAV